MSTYTTKMARSAAPSTAQTEKLIGLLEMRANLATGHARTTNARIRMRTEWSEVARILNSDGNGCVKDWKQWAKYWKDKKAGTKRKASSIEAVRQRTGGVDTELDELSDIERRILIIAGGGDRHLATNTFPEQENATALPAGSSSQSEHILVQVNPELWRYSIKVEPSQTDDTAAAIVGEGSNHEVLEFPPSNNVGNLSIKDKDDMVLPHELLQERTARESSPASMVRSSEEEGARRRILVARPQQRRRLLLPSQGLSSSSPQRRRYVHGTPRGAGTSAGVRTRASATTLRRLLRRSPPSQRRSEMASLTERFIAIEERRVEAEVAIARSQETLAEGHRIMAKAVEKLTNTVGLVAQQIIEVIQNHRAPSGAP